MCPHVIIIEDDASSRPSVHPTVSRENMLQSHLCWQRPPGSAHLATPRAHAPHQDGTGGFYSMTISQISENYCSGEIITVPGLMYRV